MTCLFRFDVKWGVWSAFAAMSLESHANEHRQTAANLRGIGYMMLAQALFIGNDTLAKLASEHIPSTQIMALRGVFAILAILAIGWRMGALRHMRGMFEKRVIVRSILEAVVAIMFLTALAHIALGDITVINQMTPLFLVALSAVVLKEIVGWRRWTAVAVGFIGVVMIVRPSGEGINIFALLAIIVAALVAMRDLITRQISPAIPSAIVALAATLSVCALGFAGAAVQEWKPVDPQVGAYIVGSAVFVAGGNFFVVHALREAEVSVVAPYRYSAVLWALLIAFFVWGDVPDALAIAGMALVVGAGLYTAHREALRARSVFRGSRKRA